MYKLLIKFESNNTKKIVEYLALILKEKFVVCDFFFGDIDGIQFNEFLDKFVNFFKTNKLENYSIIRFDHKIKDIIVIKKSLNKISISLDNN